MTPGTLVLLHSPLTTASAWGLLPERIAALFPGRPEVIVPEIDDDDRAPYASRYVARAALRITAAGVRPPLVLIAHSGAGPLLPAIGGAQRAAHRRVGGYVFLDGEFPGPAGAARLEQAQAFAPGFAAFLDAGGRFPDYPAPEGVTLRPRGKDFFTEPLPMAQDWPDAPCGYLRTSAAHDGQARQARMRGWPVVEHDAGHFAAVDDPQGTGRALAELIAAL